MSKVTGVIIAFLIIWFISGFALLGSYGKWDWQVLTGFATWVLAGGIGVAIWQIIEAKRSTEKQLKETRKSTNAQIAIEFFRELRSDRALEIFRYIYELSPEEDGKYLSRKHQHEIDYVLDRFDVLGVLVAERIIDNKLAIEAYAGVTVMRCWHQLRQYIKEVRNRRGYFSDNFEALVRLSLDYFNESDIEVKLYREDETGKIIETIDLKTKLREKEFLPRSSDEIERDRKNKTTQ